MSLPRVDCALGILAVAWMSSACSGRALSVPERQADLAGPSFDLATLDLATSDLAVTDLATPGMPDLRMPDLAVSDLDRRRLCEMVTVTTVVGNGPVDGGAGPALYPYGIAVDGAGTLYVASNDRICKVALDGAITTLAGNGTPGFADGSGGPNGTTRFDLPTGVAIDSAGQVYVTDTSNSRIRKIAPDGTTTTFAGGAPGFFDGTGGPSGTTRLNQPYGLAIDGAGQLYIADTRNDRIRKIAPDGTTTTLAGSGLESSVDGTGGPNGTAGFRVPGAVAVDSAGQVYVADVGGYRIRKIAPDGTTTTLAGNGTFGSQDGSGGPNGSASFVFPSAVAVGPDGYVYVAEDDGASNDNGRIRRIAPDGTTTTLAGGEHNTAAEGIGCDASILIPQGLALAGRQLFVTEGNPHNSVKRIQLP